jgi:hypothetical protein
MKKAAACGPCSFATAGTMFSFRFRISRKCASSIGRVAADSISSKPNVARPFFV